MAQIVRTIGLDATRVRPPTGVLWVVLLLATWFQLSPASSDVHDVHAQQQSRVLIGIVDRVSGRWIRPQDPPNDRQPLAAGTLIHEGQTLFTEHSATSSIAIVIFATGQVWRKVCTPQDPCEGSYRLPAPAAREQGFWAFLSGYWTPQRKFPSVFARARAAADAGPRHALLRITDGRADLAPALEGLPPAKYSIVLLAPAGSSAEGRPRQELSIQMQTGGGQAATVAVALAPGLYAMAITDDAGQSVGSTVAVLAIDKGFESAQHTWTSVQQEAAGWTGVQRDTVDTLLVRTLFVLDAQHHAR